MSINSNLFRAYLEDRGEQSLYEKVKGVSLGKVVLFTQIYDQLDSQDSLDIINVVRWNKGVDEAKTIHEIRKDELLTLGSIRELLDLTSNREVEVLTDVVEAIDKYHEGE